MVAGGGPCRQPDEQWTPHTPTWVSLANINAEPKSQTQGLLRYNLMSMKHEMKLAVITPRGSGCRGSRGPGGLAGFWFGTWMLVTRERWVGELPKPHARDVGTSRSLCYFRENKTDNRVRVKITEQLN